MYVPAAHSQYAIPDSSSTTFQLADIVCETCPSISDPNEIKDHSYTCQVMVQLKSKIK